MADKKVYVKTALTGGGADALDGILGSLLSNDDIAIVMLATGFYGFYRLDSDSGQAESSPLVIVPNTPLGAEAWILQGVIQQTVHLLDTDQSHDLIIQAGSDLSADRILTIITGDAARTLTINGNATVDGVTPSITSGTSAPSSTPGKIGDIYVDTSNKKLYFAAGTTSSSDWIIAN